MAGAGAVNTTITHCVGSVEVCNGSRATSPWLIFLARPIVLLLGHAGYRRGGYTWGKRMLQFWGRNTGGCGATAYLRLKRPWRSALFYETRNKGWREVRGVLRGKRRKQSGHCRHFVPTSTAHQRQVLVGMSDFLYLPLRYVDDT